MHKWAIGIALLYIAALLTYSQWPVRVGGDEFREIFLESHQHSASTWQLYKETPSEYCLRYSRGLLPSRVCVPKADVEISEGGMALRAGRRPGAKRESF